MGELKVKDLAGLGVKRLNSIYLSFLSLFWNFFIVVIIIYFLISILFVGCDLESEIELLKDKIYDDVVLQRENPMYDGTRLLSFASLQVIKCY